MSTAARKAPAFRLDFEKPLVELEKSIDDLRSKNNAHDLKLTEQIAELEKRCEQLLREIHQNLTPWQRVQIARHPGRPYMLDYVRACCSEFIEVHGDRLFGDDRAIVGGFAKLGRHRCVVLGHQKGRDTKERQMRNFGMANPEGYRKALRLMRLADRFRLPIITFVDTPGAYPGVGAEERHISEAIAVNLREMFSLSVPVLSVIIGEGGSGGALGIAVADRVLMLENAYYSVISPEGCAAILWKDRAHSPQAAEALKLSAKDLLALGIIDEIIPEPLGGAHRAPEHMEISLQQHIIRNLDKLMELPVPERLEARYQRFRKMGAWHELAPPPPAETTPPSHN
jgi:acetyl-CoA carboxylase carboxyl transferase subunit alpha